MILDIVVVLAMALSRSEATEADVSAPPSGNDEQAKLAEEAHPRADDFASSFDAIAERMIGSASRSVRFDWRRSPVSLGVVGSELIERNNFGSARIGILARRALGDAVGELALNYVWTWPTDSSELLSLTPYRQAGRPNRIEIDLNVSYAIAEGVVTPMAELIAAAEMVFFATAGLRYLVYPEAYAGLSFQDAALAVASPIISVAELDNLEGSRLPGMQVDTARYGLLAGLSLDVYFQPGVFITPRALVNIPLLSTLNGSRLGLWWETSIAVGYAL